jgi:exonuclease VII small subunit
MTGPNAKHAGACALVTLLALTAGCERRQLIDEAESQLDAAEERINEIVELHDAEKERMQRRLDRAPECPANDEYCPTFLKEAEDQMELVESWGEFYRSEETQNVLAETRRNIRRAEVQFLRRFREPAEDPQDEWVRLVRFNRTVSIERSGERAGGGFAGAMAMMGAGLLGALGDMAATDYARVQTGVEQTRQNLRNRARTFDNALREVWRLRSQTG